MFELPGGAEAGSGLADVHAAALDAFVRFSEASNTLEVPEDLGQLARQLLDQLIPSVEVGYYELEADYWRLKAYTESVPAAVVSVLTTGVPHEALPQFRQPFEAAGALFLEWDVTLTKVRETEEYITTALYPLWQQGRPFGILGLGLRERRPWSEREKLVFLAVSRALQLALERAWHGQERETRLLELERRNHALTAFAELSRDLAFESDPTALIHHAESILFSLLPGAHVQYSAAQDGGWQRQSSLGQPSQASGWETLPATDAGSVVTTPSHPTERQLVRVGDQIVGVLEVTLPETSTWSGPERVVLETVAYQLGLALERGEQSAALKQQRLALEDQASAAQLRQAQGEAFSELVWQDLRREITDLNAEPEQVRPLLARLDALLAQARLIRRPLYKTRLSLLALAMSVKAELNPTDRQVEWQLHDLPEVVADREALRAVLHELLVNALTFTRNQPDPSIKVWAEPQPEGLSVFVRDNGLGFDPRFAAQLFEPGVRAHGSGFGGEGLGLSTVRRLIERHGGRVWAEGRPGAGATFAFILP